MFYSDGFDVRLVLLLAEQLPPIHNSRVVPLGRLSFFGQERPDELQLSPGAVRQVPVVCSPTPH